VNFNSLKRRNWRKLGAGVVKESQGTIIHTVIRLHIGWSGVQIPAGARDFSSTECPDWFYWQPSLLYNGYWGSSLELKRLGLKLTTHLHLVPRMRMNTAVSLFSFYSFIETLLQNKMKSVPWLNVSLHTSVCNTWCAFWIVGQIIKPISLSELVTTRNFK